jgi:hypothetical protein
MVWLDHSSADRSQDNADFGEHLKSWLLSKGTRTPHGAIIIALVEDGFDLIAVTPDPLSGDELQEYVLLIANKIREAKSVVGR